MVFIFDFIWFFGLVISLWIKFCAFHLTGCETKDSSDTLFKLYLVNRPLVLMPLLLPIYDILQSLPFSVCIFRLWVIQLIQPIAGTMYIAHSKLFRFVRIYIKYRKFGVDWCVLWSHLIKFVFIDNGLKAPHQFKSVLSQTLHRMNS